MPNRLLVFSDQTSSCVSKSRSQAPMPARSIPSRNRLSRTGSSGGEEVRLITPGPCFASSVSTVGAGKGAGAGRGARPGENWRNYCLKDGQSSSLKAAGGGTGLLPEPRISGDSCQNKRPLIYLISRLDVRLN